MALFGLFDIGKSAILANQTALDVTANNIANINTPGFSRKEAVLTIASPVKTRTGFVGRGVTITKIRRLYDSFLQGQILNQKQNLGRSSILADIYSQVEEVFNEQNFPGLSAAMNDYFNAWQEVADNPDTFAQRTSLMQKAEALINITKDMERSLKDSLEDINQGIEDTLQQINRLAEELAALNQQIVQIEAGSSQQANDLRDTRDVLMGELAELIGFTSFEDSFGRVTIIVGGINLVYGENYRTLSTQNNVDGSLSIVVNSQTINDRITSGQLSGMLAAYDEINDTVLKDLRKLVASLIKETNLQHRQGYGLDGNNNRDFFNALNVYKLDYSDGANITSATITDNSALTLHEYEIRFTSSTNYQVYDLDTNSVVTSGTYSSGSAINFDGLSITITDDGSGPATGDKFFISTIHDAIKNFSLSITSTDEVAAASSSSTLPGDNRNALAILNKYQNTISDLDGTYNDFYNSIVNTSGTLSRAAQDRKNFEEHLLEELNLRRESLSGVNLDEEAMNLVKYQKAYEAAARLIQITDELLEVLINL